MLFIWEFRAGGGEEREGSDDPNVPLNEGRGGEAFSLLS